MASMDSMAAAPLHTQMWAQFGCGFGCGSIKKVFSNIIAGSKLPDGRAKSSWFHSAVRQECTSEYFRPLSCTSEYFRYFISLSFRPKTKSIGSNVHIYHKCTLALPANSLCTPEISSKTRPVPW